MKTTNQTPAASASRHTPESSEWIYSAQRSGILGDESSMRDDGFCVRAVEPKQFGGTIIAHVMVEEHARLMCAEHNALAGLNPDAVHRCLEALAILEPIAHRAGGEHPRYDLLNAATEKARAALAALKGGAL